MLPSRANGPTRLLNAAAAREAAPPTAEFRRMAVSASAAYRVAGAPVAADLLTHSSLIEDSTEVTCPADFRRLCLGAFCPDLIRLCARCLQSTDFHTFASSQRRHGGPALGSLQALFSLAAPPRLSCQAASNSRNSVALAPRALVLRPKSLYICLWAYPVPLQSSPLLFWQMITAPAQQARTKDLNRLYVIFCSLPSFTTLKCFSTDPCPHVF
jgi:hypothetical protein